VNLGEPGPTWDSAEQNLSGRYAETIGIVRVKRHGRSHDGASFLSGDDSLDGVLAHLRGIGWSLLVTYWDGGSLDAGKLEALPDKVDGILIDGGGIPAALLQRLAARVPVVTIGGTPDGRGHDGVTTDAPAGRQRRLLGQRACARLIEAVAAQGMPIAAETGAW
jgi:DNA-binding LacI/PurR family transcriptional regulator